MAGLKPRPTIFDKKYGCFLNTHYIKDTKNKSKSQGILKTFMSTIDKICEINNKKVLTLYKITY